MLYVARVSHCFTPLAIPPSPGGRPSLHCFAGQYLLRWFVFPICHTHVLALLPPEQSQPPNRPGRLHNRALNQLPNQPRAQLPPSHQPLPHTLCFLCKLNMCNSSKCAILVPCTSLPFLWTPNSIRVT